jgi:hypothetical protein
LTGTTRRSLRHVRPEAERPPLDLGDEDYVEGHPRLRVVVDTDTVSSDDERTRFLLGLLNREQIETYRYADNGPPPEQIRTVPNLPVSYCPGWMMFEPASRLTWDDQGSVTFATDADSWHSANVMGGGRLP